MVVTMMRFRWPIVILTLLLLWIALVTVLILRGPRQPAWPDGALGAPAGQVALMVPAASSPRMIPPSATR
jgi:hypothetical protein